MRYNLGYIDKYPLEAAGSVIENIPMFRVFLKRPVDPIRLDEAARKAMISFPLFATQVEFDKEYYLRTNTRPLVILNCNDDERPKTLGKNTNGYPWRLMYKDNMICFEWLHGITDGVGAISFFKQLILCYFGYEPKAKSLNFLVAPGMEPFIDKKEKGINFEIDPSGFSFKKFPPKYKDFRTDCHNLVGNTEELVSFSKNVNSSIALVLPIIFSQAIRKHLPMTMKNRNVSCNVALDLRRTLKYETMHNCVDLKRITYVDEYDNMSFRDVATRYKEILDNARLKENIIRSLTERIGLFKAYHIFPNRTWLKICTQLIGRVYKDIDCNIGITYLGKIDLPPEVMEELEDFDFKLWHDFGHCVLAGIDFNNTFHLHICENFKEKGVVEDFIKIADSLGLHFEEVDCNIFEQSHFVEK